MTNHCALQKNIDNLCLIYKHIVLHQVCEINMCSAHPFSQQSDHRACKNPNPPLMGPEQNLPANSSFLILTLYHCEKSSRRDHKKGVYSVVCPIKNDTKRKYDVCTHIYMNKYTHSKCIAFQL